MKGILSLQTYEGIVIAVLLILTAMGNAPLLLGVSVLLLVAGFVLFPEYRGRGLLAAIIGCAVAVVIALFFWLR